MQDSEEKGIRPGLKNPGRLHGGSRISAEPGNIHSRISFGFCSYEMFIVKFSYNNMYGRI